MCQACLLQWGSAPTDWNSATTNCSACRRKLDCRALFGLEEKGGPWCRKCRPADPKLKSMHTVFFKYAECTICHKMPEIGEGVRSDNTNLLRCKTRCRYWDECKDCHTYDHNGDFDEDSGLCLACFMTKYKSCSQCNKIVRIEATALDPKTKQSRCHNCIVTFCDECHIKPKNPDCEGLCTDCEMKRVKTKESEAKKDAKMCLVCEKYQPKQWCTCVEGGHWVCGDCIEAYGQAYKNNCKDCKQCGVKCHNLNAQFCTPSCELLYKAKDPEGEECIWCSHSTLETTSKLIDGYFCTVKCKDKYYAERNKQVKGDEKDMDTSKDEKNEHKTEEKKKKKERFMCAHCGKMKHSIKWKADESTFDVFHCDHCHERDVNPKPKSKTKKNDALIAAARITKTIDKSKNQHASKVDITELRKRQNLYRILVGNKRLMIQSAMSVNAYDKEYTVSGPKPGSTDKDIERYEKELKRHERDLRIISDKIKKHESLT